MQQDDFETLLRQLTSLGLAIERVDRLGGTILVRVPRLPGDR